jgi:hypothetical protein
MTQFALVKVPVNCGETGVGLNPYFLSSQLEDYLSDNATEETLRALERVMHFLK